MRIAHNRTPKEIENAIIELYTNFHRPSFIVKKLGVTLNVVDKVLSRNKILRNQKTCHAQMATHKQCTKCEIVKPIDNFAYGNNRKHSKINSLCKNCQEEVGYIQQVLYRNKNREKLQLYQKQKAREWRKNNPQYKIAQNCLS